MAFDRFNQDPRLQRPKDSKTQRLKDSKIPKAPKHQGPRNVRVRLRELAFDPKTHTFRHLQQVGLAGGASARTNENAQSVD